jgi:hypothetical protein
MKRSLVMLDFLSRPPHQFSLGVGAFTHPVLPAYIDMSYAWAETHHLNRKTHNMFQSRAGLNCTRRRRLWSESR